MPSKANTGDGLPIEDRIILHRFGRAIKVTDRHREELENELEVLYAIKMNDKSSLPSELKELLDEG